MQEIKIPEGCKASIDFEKRVVVIESEKPKFKRGDVIISEWAIVIFKSVGVFNEVLDFVCYDTQCNDMYIGRGGHCGYVETYSLATPAEQQLLFDALAKEGKKWNADTLQVEDIEKDIPVPESIGIYKHKHRLDLGLLIGFNYDSQFLGYHPFNKQWLVASEQNKYEKVQCKLTPCKRENLKAGDTAFVSETFRLDDSMLSDRGRYVKIIGNKAIKINKIGEPIYDNAFHNHWYKVEPINK